MTMKATKLSVLSLVATALIISAAISCAPRSHVAGADRAVAPKKTLRPFRSELELKGYFRDLAEKQKREWAKRRRMSGASSNATALEPMVAADSGDVSKSAERAKEEDSVTNTQHAGVDEGGIVKLHGDHLVVLRRGRLFTVAIGGDELKPVSAVDAFAPDIDPRSTWYDEMLVSQDTVVVVGYSYERGGTEIGLFDIDRAGSLKYRSTYHLRSNDYYSSRNYSSRLIGSKLIFYTPLHLPTGQEDVSASFPALRKWHKGANASEFQRIVSATRVYRAEREPRATYGLALHTVTVCDLARADFACEATAVVGAPGRVFYVSPESVYVWVAEWMSETAKPRQSSMVYRMPLDGSAPSALGVSGSPVDQFSFLESGDKHLNVLVRSDAAGDGMWRAEVAEGEVALLRVPLASFSDGVDYAPASSYRPLPKPQGYTFQNRFVGDYLLYGTGSGWGAPEKSNRGVVFALRWAGGATAGLPLAHGVDRIEAMGSDAVVVGTDGKDLHFTGVRLGAYPIIASSYVRKDATQGELRSQGFFYKPDGADAGVLGLPVRGAGRPGYEHLFDGSASILFLRNDSLRLSELGELDARPDKSSADDACRASCVDWYGNARPLFLRGRVFALLGYEIVEGALADNRIRETRRVSYAPRRMQTSER
ncbi:MAG: beta-propeller domain-containing protein [Acidobacteria bacterium]|nr:beta-propeller domain-containing protein [Acidobacteriota bacterium]MCA1641173.1 beta-propeller domain-containing protein [Acidobacteriota bacterium]